MTEPKVYRMPNKGASKFRQVSQHLAASLFAIVFTFQSGCAFHVAVPKTQHQSTLGKVAIITTAQEPEVEFRGFARGKGEGAAKGAGTTFLACAGAGGSCSGDFCGAFYIVWLGICGVASAVGGVVGAIAAPSAEEVRAAESTLPKAQDAKIIQESLRDHVAAAALAKPDNVEGSSKFRQVSQHLAASLFAIVFTFQSGCAFHVAVPKTQHQSTLGKVAIITTAQEPEVEFRGFARGKGEGAAKGAGTTFLACAVVAFAPNNRPLSDCQKHHAFCSKSRATFSSRRAGR